MAAFDCNPAQKPVVYDLLGQLNGAFCPRDFRPLDSVVRLKFLDCINMPLTLAG